MKKKDFPKNSKGGGASVGGKGSGSASGVSTGYDPTTSGDSDSAKRAGMMSHVSKHDKKASSHYKSAKGKLANGPTEISESRKHDGM